MLTPSNRQKTNEEVWLWMLKMIAGLVIIVILFIHFVINHLVAPTGLLSYADVIAYYQIPIVPVMEIIFIIFVVVHALLGLRSIILDLNPPARIIKISDIGMSILGICAIVYGIGLIVVLVGRG